VVYNVYDAADQLQAVEIDPAPLTKAQAATHPSYEAYGYDAAGNQTVALDADNRTTTTQYDGDNRAVQSVAVSYPPTGTTNDHHHAGLRPRRQHAAADHADRRQHESGPDADAHHDERLQRRRLGNQQQRRWAGHELHVRRGGSADRRDDE